MAMRSRRTTHVRPRPPSDGRPRPRALPTRARAPLGERLARHHPLRRGTGLPLPASLLLVVAILALGGTVLLVGTGELGRAVGGIGGAFAGVIERLVPPAETPGPSAAVAAGAPTLITPSDPYVNTPTVNVPGTIPLDLVGAPQTTIRLYLVQAAKAPALLKEIPVGGTPSFVFAGVALSPGENSFVATIRGPGGESEQSLVVTYVLDRTAPTIRVSSPKNGQVVSTPTATIAGTTKAGSAISARNDANGATASTTAGGDGSFQVTLQLAAGSNAISLRATDRAGNVGTLVLTVKRSTGQPLIVLTASPNRLSASKPPTSIILTATVTAASGGPLAGGTLTFTLSLPGLPVISQDLQTDASGKASWAVPLAGLQPGTGTGTVCIQSGATPPACTPGARVAIIVRS